MRKVSEVSCNHQIGEFINAFLVGREESAEYKFEEAEEASLVISEHDKLNKDDAKKDVKIAKKNNKQMLSMRRANIESSESKIIGVASKNSPGKEAGPKLNADLLSKLEFQGPPPFQLNSATDSYLEDLRNFRDDSYEESIVDTKYLEKKYLSSEFLFNSIDPQRSLMQSDTFCLRFENLVNKILSENEVDYKWYFYIHNFVNKIIKTVKPNANRPNEVINYNDYVTVR